MASGLKARTTGSASKRPRKQQIPLDELAVREVEAGTFSKDVLITSLPRHDGNWESKRFPAPSYADAAKQVKAYLSTLPEQVLKMLASRGARLTA